MDNPVDTKRLLGSSSLKRMDGKGESKTAESLFKTADHL